MGLSLPISLVPSCDANTSAYASSNVHKSNADLKKVRYASALEAFFQDGGRGWCIYLAFVFAFLLPWFIRMKCKRKHKCECNKMKSFQFLASALAFAFAFALRGSCHVLLALHFVIQAIAVAVKAFYVLALKANSELYIIQRKSVILKLHFQLHCYFLLYLLFVRSLLSPLASFPLFLSLCITLLIR